MDPSSFTYEHYGILVQSEDDDISKPNQLCGMNVHNLNDGEYSYSYIAETTTYSLIICIRSTTEKVLTK